MCFSVRCVWIYRGYVHVAYDHAQVNGPLSNALYATGTIYTSLTLHPVNATGKKRTIATPYQQVQALSNLNKHTYFCKSTELMRACTAVTGIMKKHINTKNVIVMSVVRAARSQLRIPRFFQITSSGRGAAWQFQVVRSSLMRDVAAMTWAVRRLKVTKAEG
jgi:hypothetical protein